MTFIVLILLLEDEDLIDEFLEYLLTKKEH